MLEWAIWNAAGNGIVKSWETFHAFDRYSKVDPLHWIDMERLVPAAAGATARKNGYVFLVTHASFNSSRCFDTRGINNGNYMLKIRARDVAGHEKTKQFPITIANLVDVEDKEVLVAQTKQITVTVIDGNGAARADVPLTILATYDSDVVEQPAWVNNVSTTNNQGKAFVNITGKSDGVTDLTIKDAGTGAEGTGRIVVGDLVIEVPDLDLYVGETKSVTVIVKNRAGVRKQGITLDSDFMMNETVAIVLGANGLTDGNGEVVVSITGKSVGVTDLRLKDVASAATGTGEVVVKDLVIEMKDPVVTAGAIVWQDVFVKDTEGALVPGISVYIDELGDMSRASCRFEGEPETDVNGKAILRVAGLRPGERTLILRTETALGASATWKGKITVQLPVVSVPDTILLAGGTGVVVVGVSNSVGEGLSDVVLEIVPIQGGKATASWQGEAITSSTGTASVTVTGVAAGTAILKITATVSGASGKGTITVNSE
jgi:hypothetical protein